jgi:ribonucleotide reductase beta subunit family protein with ferritin-like domain
MSAAETQILEKVQMVAQDARSFGVLSTGERIAVALVFDRQDLLQKAWGTMLEAVHRLGPEWTLAALRVQRNGWQDEE